MTAVHGRRRVESCRLTFAGSRRRPAKLSRTGMGTEVGSGTVCFGKTRRARRQRVTRSRTAVGTADSRPSRGALRDARRDHRHRDDQRELRGGREADLAQQIRAVEHAHLACSITVGGGLVDLSALSIVSILYLAAARPLTNTRPLFNVLLA